MDASAEQLVLDYLGRLGDAAQRVLSLDERLRFMVSARVAIAGQIEEIGTASASDARRLLGRFGDPGELAARERQRLDEASRASAARSRDMESVQAVPAMESVQAVPATPRTAPGAQRPVTARRRPGEAVSPRQADRSPADRSPTGESGHADGATPPSVAGTGRSAPVIRSVLVLVRAHPLESLAVLLLGVGGLVSPFPMWFLGALVVLISRLWDARDKWASLAFPAVLALMGSFVIAGQGSRRGGFPGYLDAARADGWGLLRAGAVLGAAYLAWRIRQGRRARREPPWRRVPHA